MKLNFPSLHRQAVTPATESARGREPDTTDPMAGMPAASRHGDCPRVAAALATAASALLGAAVLVLGGCVNPSAGDPRAEAAAAVQVGWALAVDPPKTWM